MVGELDVQKECQRQLCEHVNELRATIVSQANEIKNRNPNVTERSLILFSAVVKLTETSRVVLMMRNIDAVDEMNVLLRSMVELTINAYYLQEASDAVLVRFFQFDKISGYIAMQDLVRASGGRYIMPKDLEDRVTKLAEDAYAATNLPRKERTWSPNFNLAKRAKTIDDAVGDEDFAVLLANTYVTGSGYVHGTYKTLHRYAQWLIRSKEEHPLRILFGTNNAIHGVALVLLNLGRYFNRKFDTDRNPFNAFAKEQERLVIVMGKDHDVHRKSE